MTFAWVIENCESSATEYFTGNRTGALRWSSDNKDACRFSRREDAQRIATFVDGARPHRVVEHGWEADDSEPVTIAWMREELGACEHPSGWLSVGRLFCLPTLPWSWAYGMTKLDVCPKTRGEVRRLMAALGIPLKFANLTGEL